MTISVRRVEFEYNPRPLLGNLLRSLQVLKVSDIKNPRRKILGLGVCLALMQFSEFAMAQSDADAKKEVRVVRVDAGPVIDGKIDEAVWDKAEKLTDFHQMRPNEGAEPSEPTEVFLLYDDDALYIAARMYDSEPDLIAAPTVRHGQ